MKISRISSNYNRKDYVDPCGGSIMSWLCWDISLSNRLKSVDLRP